MKKKIAYTLSIFISVFFLIILVNKHNPYLRTDIFRSFARGNWYILSEADTIYTMGYHGVRKYVAKSPNNFELLAENDEICKNRIKGRGGCINNEFLYVSARSFLPGPVKSSSINGALYIFRKKDLSLVNTLLSDIKFVEAKIHNEILVVSGLTGFNVYDCSTPYTPVEIFSYRHSKYREYQGFDFFEKDEMLLVAFSLFGEGLEIWDITKPKNAKSICLIPINEQMANGNELPGGQSMDVVVKSPYVYATLGPSNETYKTENDKRGILVYDISNIDEIKKSAVVIPKSDWYKSFLTSGDKQPTYITLHGDSLYVNFERNGVAIFDISDASKPRYHGLIDISGKAALIQPIHATDNGKLFTGSYYWTTVYGVQINNIKKSQ